MQDLVLKKLRALRRDKNYSQEFISQKLNISQSFYGRIENGKAILSVRVLHKILKVLDTNYVEFFDEIKAIEKKNIGS